MANENILAEASAWLRKTSGLSILDFSNLPFGIEVRDLMEFLLGGLAKL